MSSMPPARFEPENRGGAATIGKAVKVVGNIYSREDLYVDGDLEGTVEAIAGVTFRQQSNHVHVALIPQSGFQCVPTPLHLRAVFLVEIQVLELGIELDE